MNRRQSFFKITLRLITSLGLSVVSTCKLLADHFSSYAWPSYPKEEALREHLLGKPHNFTKKEVDALTFQQCREHHDKHHADLGGKPPAQSRLWMNQVYEKPKESIPEERSHERGAGVPW